MQVVVSGNGFSNQSYELIRNYNSDVKHVATPIILVTPTEENIGVKLFTKLSLRLNNDTEDKRALDASKANEYISKLDINYRGPFTLKEKKKGTTFKASKQSAISKYFIAK